MIAAVERAEIRVREEGICLGCGAKFKGIKYAASYCFNAMFCILKTNGENMVQEDGSFGSVLACLASTRT